MKDYCLNILNEWIESADDSRFKAALALLTEIESDYIFRRPDYVEFVLTKAQKHSVERFERAKSALFFCARVTVSLDRSVSLVQQLSQPKTAPPNL